MIVDNLFSIISYLILLRYLTITRHFQLELMYLISVSESLKKKQFDLFIFLNFGVALVFALTLFIQNKNHFIEYILTSKIK